MRFASLLALIVVAAACSEPTAPSAGSGGGPSPTSPGFRVSAASTRGAGDSPDASIAASAVRPADAGPPPYEGPYIGATVFQALVMSEMEWPPAEGKKSSGSSIRLGYLRQGQKAPVIPEAHKKSNCPEGWYELVAGGYVCGKYASLDLSHPKFRQAHAPDLNAAVPYSYAVNNVQGSPLYRVVPSREERLRYEPWLVKPKKSKSEEDNPWATPDPPDAAMPDPNAPWYLREMDASAPPQVTLDELKEENGPVARRMVKGFFLSVDRPFSSNGGQWWRTTDGLIAPAASVYLTKPLTDYHGVWLSGAEGGQLNTYAKPDAGAPRSVPKLPIGFITRVGAHKWILSAQRKSASMGGPLHKFETFGLTGENATVGGSMYWQTTEDWWMREIDGTLTDPGPPPEGLGANEKWIDVNLMRQTLVAFEGDRPVFATIISSGRSQHETPPGSFRIREKHVASTMDGDADVASDGPYSIQDVPYIEYFSGGYALHGAFWHAEFGHVKSHGCVNLAPWDARALFAWTDPQLPEGWHGVWSTKEKPGTRVVLH